MIKKNYNKLFFSLILFFIATCSIKPIVHAEENAAGFSYILNQPENQIDKSNGYLDLLMEPKMTQSINIPLTNTSDKDISINVSINGAKTNQNGVVEYGDSVIENDKSLKYAFEDIVKAPKEVKLKANETKNLKVEINMPETSYEGIIAGGIQLIRNGQENDSNNDNSQVINKYAYVIPVLLKEAVEKIPAELKLTSVKATQNNYRNSVVSRISNIKPGYLENVTVEAQVSKAGQETVLYEKKQTSMKMAPNTFLDYYVDMNGEQMEAGKYQIKILVTADDKKWDWTEEFEITKEEAEKYNERDVGLVQEKGIEWKVVFIIIGAVLLLAIMIYIFIFMKKYKSKKKKSNKKRK